MTSCEWDHSKGWKVNIGKTTSFGVGQKPPPLHEGIERVEEVPVLRYLGHEVHTRGGQERIVLKERVTSVKGTLDRIAQLPRQVGVEVLLQVVAMTAMPQLTYGYLTRDIPKATLKGLTAKVRKTVWGGRKQFHNWQAAALCCYCYHRIHPEACSTYQNLMAITRALRSLNREELGWLSDLFQQPLHFGRTPGPIQQFQLHLAQLGFIPIEQWRYAWGEQEMDLVSSDLKRVGHVFREALRAQGLHQISRQRQRYRDAIYTDIPTTSKLYRQKTPYASEVVTLVSDGLWTKDRQCRAGKVDNDLCDLCNIREDLEHVLWICPRWERERAEIPRVVIEGLGDSLSARLCGMSRRDHSEGVRAKWPIYQLAQAKIIRQYQEHAIPHARGEGAGSFGTGAGVGPDTDIPTGTHASWVSDLKLNHWQSLSHPLDISAQIERERHHVRWPYADASYAQLLHVLSQVRLAHEPVHDIPRVSVIELMISFIVCNGGVRFCTGVSDATGGARLGIQVDKFQKAILAWQKITLGEPILPPRGNNHTMVKWQVHYGFPASSGLVGGVIIPRWREVRHFMRELAGNSQGTPWRLWEPGMAHSQMSHTRGQLLPYTLIWCSGFRVGGKRAPRRWEIEREEARPYVRTLRVHPLGQQHIDNEPLWHIWRGAGITNRDQMQQFRRRLGILVRRLGTYQSIAIAARETFSHISCQYAPEHRPVCAACGLSGPMHGDVRWLRSPCGHFDPSLVTSVTTTLRCAKENLDRIHLATVRVLRG